MSMWSTAHENNHTMCVAIIVISENYPILVKIQTIV